MSKTQLHHVTIRELQKAGLPITPGHAYIPKAWLPKHSIPIEEVHRRLAKIKGSLAQDIAEMREQG